MENALAQLGPGGGGQSQSEEAIGREVEAMREEMASLRTQLHTLNSIRKKMRYVCLALGELIFPTLKKSKTISPYPTFIKQSLDIDNLLYLCVCCHSDHYATVVGERDQLLQQKIEAQHSYQKSMERGGEENKKVCVCV